MFESITGGQLKKGWITWWTFFQTSKRMSSFCLNFPSWRSSEYELLTSDMMLKMFSTFLIYRKYENTLYGLVLIFYGGVNFYINAIFSSVREHLHHGEKQSARCPRHSTTITVCLKQLKSKGVRVTRRFTHRDEIWLEGHLLLKKVQTKALVPTHPGSYTTREVGLAERNFCLNPNNPPGLSNRETGQS